MGLYIRRDEQRSQLQERIAAELQEKIKQKAHIEFEKPESAILENQHQTRIAGRVILILALLMVVAIVLLALRAGGLI